MSLISTMIIAVGMTLFTYTDTNAIQNDLCNAIYDQCMADNPFHMILHTSQWFGYTVGCANSRNACEAIISEI